MGDQYFNGPLMSVPIDAIEEVFKPDTKSYEIQNNRSKNDQMNLYENMFEMLAVRHFGIFG